MDLQMLREQHTDDDLARMAVSAERMAQSGEREVRRLEQWQQCPLSTSMGSEPGDEIARYRRSAEASRELAVSAKAAAALSKAR